MMRPHILAVVLGACLVAAPTSRASAQTAGSGETKSKVTTASETLAAPANLNFGATPGADGKNKTSAVQVILDATKKDKIGTAAFGWATGKEQVQLSFSGPVGGAPEEEATPISLTGLGAGAKAKVSYSRIFWRAPNPLEQDQIVKLCQRLGMMPKPTGPNGTYTKEDLELGAKMTPCNSRNIENPDDRVMFDFLSHTNATPWMLGVDATAGQASHKFVDKITLEPGSSKKPEWTVAARAGVYRQGIGFFLVSYTYLEVHKAAGAATEICRPMADVTVVGATKCESLIVGGPSRQTTSVVTAELRRLVSGRFAMSPSLLFDLKEKDDKRVWGVELPLYFLTASDSISPTGGVRLGWRSDTKEVTAVIFIGGAFKLFG